MNGINSRDQAVSVINYLLVVTLACTLLLPSFRIVSNIPAIDFSDILIPIIFAIALFFSQEKLVKTINSNATYCYVFSIFLSVVILSIIVNGRYLQIRDWLEVFKYIKFFGAFILCITFLNYKMLLLWLKAIFIGLLVFNTLHYFNLFNFNKLIEPYYAAKHHLDFFGLNSIGEPATKRALGTLGNPNNNGFLFLIFTIIFLPSKEDNFNWKNLIFPTLSILAMIACQSRTVFIAFIPTLLVYFYFSKINWRFVLYFVLVAVLVFIQFDYFGNSYIGSISNANTMENAGRSRWDEWTKIVQSMPGNWLLGHGPNKQFFESNGIYAESEYLLILFRYGIIGLIAYLFFFASLLHKNIQRDFIPWSIIFYFFLAYLIVALTNTPFHSVKLNVLIAVVLSLGWLKSKNAKETV